MVIALSALLLSGCFGDGLAPPPVVSVAAPSAEVLDRREAGVTRVRVTSGQPVDVVVTGVGRGERCLESLDISVGGVPSDEVSIVRPPGREPVTNARPCTTVGRATVTFAASADGAPRTFTIRGAGELAGGEDNTSAAGFLEVEVVPPGFVPPAAGGGSTGGSTTTPTPTPAPSFSPSTIPVAGALSVAVGDVDRGPNGRADVVVGSQPITGTPQGRIRVFRTGDDGRPALAQTIDLPTSARPVALDAADLEQDADVDVVVAMDLPGPNDRLGILRNDGSGTLDLEGVQPPAGPEPGDVVIAEFNGNTTRDLAVANTDGVGVLLNVGGTFPYELPIAGNNPHGIAAGPLTAGDGQADIAFTRGTGAGVAGARNETPQNATAPVFAPQETIISSGVPGWGITTTTADANGQLDLGVAGLTTDSVRALSNVSTTSGPTFSFLSQTIPVGSTPRGITAGEFGSVSTTPSEDLAVANQLSDTVSVLINNGFGYTGFPVPVGPAPLDVAAGRLGPTSPARGDLAVVGTGGTGSGGTLTTILRSQPARFAAEPAQRRVRRRSVSATGTIDFTAVKRGATTTRADGIPQTAYTLTGRMTARLTGRGARGAPAGLRAMLNGDVAARLTVRRLPAVGEPGPVVSEGVIFGRSRSARSSSACLRVSFDSRAGQPGANRLGSVAATGTARGLTVTGTFAPVDVSNARERTTVRLTYARRGGKTRFSAACRAAWKLLPRR